MLGRRQTGSGEGTAARESSGGSTTTSSASGSFSWGAAVAIRAGIPSNASASTMFKAHVLIDSESFQILDGATWFLPFVGVSVSLFAGQVQLLPLVIREGLADASCKKANGVRGRSAEGEGRAPKAGGRWTVRL